MLFSHEGESAQLSTPQREEIQLAPRTETKFLTGEGATIQEALADLQKQLNAIRETYGHMCGCEISTKEVSFTMENGKMIAIQEVTIVGDIPEEKPEGYYTELVKDTVVVWGVSLSSQSEAVANAHHYVNYIKEQGKKRSFSIEEAKEESGRNKPNGFFYAYCDLMITGTREDIDFVCTLLRVFERFQWSPIEKYQKYMAEQAVEKANLEKDMACARALGDAIKVNVNNFLEKPKSSSTPEYDLGD